MTKKLTYEEVKLYIEDINECKLISTHYEHSKNKLKIKCNCGEIFNVRFGDFKNKNQHQCKKCGNENGTKTKRLSYEYVKEYITSFDYELIDKEYKNNYHKMNIKCNNHHIYKATFNCFKTGDRCPKCSGKGISSKKTTQDFKKAMLDLVGNKYSVLGKYTGTNKYIKIKHNICSKEYDVTPANFLTGNRCPFCCDRNNSRGAKRIDSYLSRNVFRYEREWKIDNCKNIRPLRFDFAILNFHNMVECLIEFDGEHHYHAVKIWKGNEGFKQQQKNDQLKNEYCKQNNIPLIRIPYYHFDYIEDILDYELRKLGLLK